MRFKKMLSTLILSSLMLMPFVTVSSSYAISQSDEDYIKKIAEEYIHYAMAVYHEVGTVDGMIPYDTYVSKRPFDFGEKNVNPLYSEFSHDLLNLACDVGKMVRSRHENYGISDDELDNNAYFGIMNFSAKYSPNFFSEASKGEKDLKPIENNNSGEPYVNFVGVSIDTSVHGHSFIGEIKNNHPNMTFSGFGEVVLYKKNTVIDVVTIVINDTPPNGKSSLWTLPTLKEFDNYEIRITTPIWN